MYLTFDFAGLHMLCQPAFTCIRIGLSFLAPSLLDVHGYSSVVYLCGLGGCVTLLLQIANALPLSLALSRRETIELLKVLSHEGDPVPIHKYYLFTDRDYCALSSAKIYVHMVIHEIS